MHYCDHALSVVRPSIVNFSHFRLLLWNHQKEFNETWQEARSQCPLPSLCFLGWSEKQDGCPGLWLRHFQLLLWNHSTEFNKTWQEARSQCPLPSLCFSGRLEQQDARPGLWLAETFLTSILKPLNGIQRNLTWSKISTSFTEFVFFGPIGKTRWLPWPLIGWDIFDFSSETTEQNSTKHDRKQDLNVLYQVFVFRTNRKNKMAALVSDWLRHFRLLLWNRWTEFNETWQEARSQRPLLSLCFSGRSEKWSPWPIPPRGGVLYSGAWYVALWASCWIYTSTSIVNMKKYELNCKATLAKYCWSLLTFISGFEHGIGIFISQVDSGSQAETKGLRVCVPNIRCNLKFLKKSCLENTFRPVEMVYWGILLASCLLAELLYSRYNYFPHSLSMLTGGGRDSASEWFHYCRGNTRRSAELD